jgi:hypothetical protein
MNTDQHGLERTDAALTRPAATLSHQAGVGQTAKFFHPRPSVSIRGKNRK